MSRDISVAAYSAFTKGLGGYASMADPIAGIGAGGLRVAVEASEVDEAFINDLSPTAIDYARASADVNRVAGKCRFSVFDAYQFLAGHSKPAGRLDIVDLDPYGSPATYMDCALRAVQDGGLVSITATDMAVLCGVYPRVAARKYGVYSIRTEYCHEVGMGLLLGALAGILPGSAWAYIPYFLTAR